LEYFTPKIFGIFHFKFYENGLGGKDPVFGESDFFFLVALKHFLMKAKLLSRVHNALGEHSLEIGQLGGETWIANFADYDHEKYLIVVDVRGC